MSNQGVRGFYQITQTIKDQLLSDEKVEDRSTTEEHPASSINQLQSLGIASAIRQKSFLYEFHASEGVEHRF